MGWEGGFEFIQFQELLVVPGCCFPCFQKRNTSMALERIEFYVLFMKGRSHFLLSFFLQQSIQLYLELKDSKVRKRNKCAQNLNLQSKIVKPM